MSLKPLIAICGTTGVGKSNLAIDLALQLAHGGFKSRWKGARVINADSMQVYEGLDIITNKITEDERRGVEHLLMGFKKPGEQYVVGDWVRDALELIDDIHDRNEIPIVVGGTSYWIQHLIFSNRLSRSESPLPIGNATASEWPAELKESIGSLPPELLAMFNDPPCEPPSAKTEPEEAFKLHDLLSRLDPPIGARWHWRDTRKVLRSLRIIYETRRRASDIIAEQSSAVDLNKPRFRTLCFWLYADPLTLNSRLDERVDTMIKQGLLDELYALHEISRVGQAQQLPDVDYTLGIYQAIGCKEFHDYLNTDVPSEKIFQDAVERMKLSTRQYAKRQISWIRNKLLPAVYASNEDQIMVPTYLLDATELGLSWTTNVREPATRITQNFLEDDNLPDPYSLSENAKKMLTIEQKDTNPIATLEARRKIICPICTTREDQPVMMEEGEQWETHKKSKAHRRLSAKRQRREPGRDSRARDGCAKEEPKEEELVATGSDTWCVVQ
ncbi:tRNA isopentenyltransferase [Crucibulum laeve]|uniref:tRNA isopentenyltransferase n=1 Tax=Crucibulum laeve TaxID=68775 RepID=A0A5C3MEG7_9AGAR|nr:tRNA isopentenyltransferase [Crucibulum laeve]